MGNGLAMLLRLLVLAAVVSCLPALADAAVEIEASAENGHLRLVIDRERARVLVQKDATASLVDLRAGDVYLDSGDGAPERIRVRFRPGHEEPAAYRLEPFAPGPVVAGHASRYHVLFVEDQVCAEILVSGWMRPFVDPAVRALALLDELKGAARDDPCAEIPFATLAAAGWPLLSGKIDSPTFETLAIRFDYRPKPGELAVPELFEDAPTTRAGAPALQDDS